MASEATMPSAAAPYLRIVCTIGLSLAAIDFAAAQETAPSRQPEGSVEASYLRENDAAMTKMMKDMTVRPTGDVDRDFALMMIPLHQGAIDMAVAELRYGRNEQLRRMAQEIIVDQMQEIAAMRLAIGEPPPAASTAPTQQPAPMQMGPPANAMSQHDHHMVMPAAQ
jgi:hypothetical protein